MRIDFPTELDSSECHALFYVVKSKFNCPLVSKPLLSQSGSKISQQRLFCLDIQETVFKKNRFDEEERKTSLKSCFSELQRCFPFFCINTKLVQNKI
jgi:hypothetical protein